MRMSRVFAAVLAMSTCLTWTNETTGQTVVAAGAEEITELGEYLSSQCSSCHQQGSCENGIPPLGDLPDTYFVIAMERFKKGLRPNEVMKSVVDSLHDDEIRALAAYYATLGPTEC